MRSVIGVVIVYFPGSQLRDNILSFSRYVDEVLIIDNSYPATDWQEPLAPDKITIIKNTKNTGVAAALNTAASYALSKKATWLLTMDQDSRFENGNAERLIDSSIKADADIAICCPAYRSEKPSSPSFVRFAMTSGSMIQLRAYQQCGPFDEKLFIDSVDHEYCLRLRKAGWKILKTDAVLHHHPGKRILHHLYGIRVRATEHAASRHYFMARNRLVVMFRYLSFDPLFFLHEFFEYPKQLARIVVFEKQKLKRLNYMAKGIFHFLARRFPDHA